MSKRLLVAAMCGMLCAAGLQAASAADSPVKSPDTTTAKPALDPAIGKTLADFSLPDFHGNEHTLQQYADKKAVVVVFLGTECPLAKLYAPRLVELSREFRERGVVFLGVDANSHDTPSKLTQFAQANHIDFPLLKDVGNTMADQLGATRTPEVFLLDQNKVVRYHGRVDDQYGVGVQWSKVTRRDLASAIEELLGGKEVSKPTSPFTGCVIARVRKTAPHGDITYSQHVAAIFNHSCVECHRAGELAPFTLTSYDDVVGWSDTIREVVGENRMPPWFADPQIGKFSNDCSLTEKEKQTIFTWIDNGCPEGSRSELPAPPKFTLGWRMGQPDKVYEMPIEYTVPAEGTVDYQYFTVDPELKEDLWVTTAEGRPGNPAIVHHIVLFAVPPGRTLRNPEDAQAMGQMVAVYAPGMNPWRYPAGTAMKIEAGSKFVLQLHYTPNGIKQIDKSYVGLQLTPASKVKKRVRYAMAVNTSFEIPAGASDTEVVSRALILKDLLLLNLFPHMHYRGKSFRFEAEYPDGRREVLLDVPRYDFAWQLRYDLTEPKLLPKGSRLICTGHFDNSESNPFNPDPTQNVRFGLQTYEEMMVGYYSTVAVDEQLTNTDSPSDAKLAREVAKP